MSEPYHKIGRKHPGIRLHDIIELPQVVGRRVDKPFEFIDHTADIGIIAYGADFRQAFANAAAGLFSLITELDDVNEGEQRTIELSAENEEILLVEWLNELIYIFDVEQLVFKRFEVDELAGNRLKARCFGEKIEPERHKLKMGVKAATYHMLKMSKDDEGYSVQVILDV